MRLLWRSTTKRDRAAEPQIHRVPVGFDRFAAHALVARCEAEGLQVKLLTMDENGNVSSFVERQEQQLLVHERNLERVLALRRNLDP